MPVDYLIICLKTLRIFIDNLLPSFNSKTKSLTLNSNQSTTPSSSLFNMFNMFGKPSKNYKGGDELVISPYYIQIQSVIMQLIPKIITTMCSVWSRIVKNKQIMKYSDGSFIHSSSVLGSSQIVSK